MKVQFDITPETDLEIVKDDKGRPVSILFKPLFSSAKGAVTLVHGQVLAEGSQPRSLDRFSLAVSGATGRLVKRDRTGGIVAAADMSPEEAAAASNKRTRKPPSNASTDKSPPPQAVQRRPGVN